MKHSRFIFSNEFKYRLRRHLAFWIFWWLFQGFLYSFLFIDSNSYGLRLLDSMLESLIFMTVHISLSYALMYFVIPKYVLTQRYRLAAVWTVLFFFLSACLSSLLAISIIRYIRNSLLGMDYAIMQTTLVNIHFSLMAGLRGSITIGGIAAAIKLMKYWYVKEQRNLELQRENLESQLQILKAQVHPHFLFNTLNNIYSYTQNTSPEASKLVMGLSDILRYMLYDCNQPTVPLSKELNMLEEFISLEKIRYGNRLELHTDLPRNTQNLYIAPLLLIPFVENCFKHGLSDVLEQPWLSMTISITGREMTMKLVNGKPPGTSRQTDSHGIGISNVRKRLELLYPDQHELIINEEEEVFIVNLKLQLERKKPNAESFLQKQIETVNA